MTPQQLPVNESSERIFPLPTTTPNHKASALIHEFPRFAPQTASSPRTIRVALAGCGVVGGGLVRLLHDSRTAIASRFGVRFEITRVLVRDTARDRGLPIDSQLFTNDLVAFLDGDADVVIEAVGGEEPARSIALSALRRGRKLITANKELIATHGAWLDTLATRHSAALDFGAAVGGSAPVISTLRDLVGAVAPRSLRGILNGTSNFVISEVERGVSLDVAIANARVRGLAEADCSRDLDGRDAAAKLSIIGWIGFGIQPRALNIRRISLLPGLERLVQFGTSLDARVRLLAECTRLSNNTIVASVEPVLLPSSSPFARVVGEENRVEVDLGWSQPLSVSGPGAGGAPTASALLSDLLRASAPPNDRGRAAAKFSSVVDCREHRWLIAADLSAPALQATACGAELPVTNVSAGDGGGCVIVGPARWERIAPYVHELTHLNVRPCIARYELASIPETCQ